MPSKVSQRRAYPQLARRARARAQGLVVIGVAALEQRLDAALSRRLLDGAKAEQFAVVAAVAVVADDALVEQGVERHAHDGQAEHIEGMLECALLGRADERRVEMEQHDAVGYATGADGGEKRAVNAA